MIPRLCVLDALAHCIPARLPYRVLMEEAVRHSIDRELGGRRWRDELVSFFHEVFFLLPARERFPGGRYRDAYGSVWESGNITRVVEPVLRNPSFDRFQWPDIDDQFDRQEPRLRADLEARSEMFRFATFGFGLFERSWTLRGYTQILMDLVSEPAFCEDLYDALFEHQAGVVARLLELPIDGIMFCDDWGQQNGLIMGPDLWRQFIKPRKARLLEQVHRAGKKAFLHCCGDVAEVVPEMVEIGLDCLESLQPEAMDPFTLKQRWGDGIALWGGGPSQSLIPSGQPAEIRRAFARLRREMSVGGGYICAPAKEILADTPVANAIAAVEGVVGYELPRG